MSKVLLVVEGKEQAYIAIRHVIDRAKRKRDDTFIILNVMPVRPSWQRRDEPLVVLNDEGERQARLLEIATRDRESGTGIEYEIKCCVGDVAEAVLSLRSADTCEEVVIAEPTTGAFAKLVYRITGLRTSSTIDRIIAMSPVPVTIITKRTADCIDGASNSEELWSSKERRNAASLSTLNDCRHAHRAD